MPEGSKVLVNETAVPDEAAATRRQRAGGPRTESPYRPSVQSCLFVGAAVWVLYLAACLAPAFLAPALWSLEGPPSPGSPVAGWRVLTTGWLAAAVLWPPDFFPWSANLLLLLGWLAYLRGRARGAAIAGVIAALMGLTALVMPGWQVERLLLGYYLWQASLVVFAVAAVRGWWWSAPSACWRGAERAGGPGVGGRVDGRISCSTTEGPDEH